MDKKSKIYMYPIFINFLMERFPNRYNVGNIFLYDVATKLKIV